MLCSGKWLYIPAQQIVRDLLRTAKRYSLIWCSPGRTLSGATTVRCLRAKFSPRFDAIRLDDTILEAQAPNDVDSAGERRLCSLLCGYVQCAGLDGKRKDCTVLHSTA